jgi:ABC-type antimicrobial peptide transport system permease subunit
LSGNGNTTWFRVLGRPWHGEHNEAPERDVSTGYFKALDAKQQRGRYFNETEDTSKPRVAIINQAFARQYFPGEDALGKRLAHISTPPVPVEIVGLYGVVAYSVSQRTREIGVRMALGAQPRSVHHLVLKEAAWLTAAGVVTGLLCSVAAATVMRGLLFGVESWDVPTLAAVAALLGISALVASYIPARHAASVSPVEALRAE